VRSLGALAQQLHQLAVQIVDLLAPVGNIHSPQPSALS
jgi:hypothetical protein